MALTKYKLGELIYEITRRNDDLKYGIDYVRGVSNTKEIMPTKADVSQDVIHKFYVIMPGEFIYNPRTTRMGDKVGLAYNDTDTPLLFTFNNLAFAIREESKNLILPDYLYTYFNRSEFDRYAIVNSWGSATELFTFEEMCDIDIELPPLPVQQKYVAIYKAMIANQQSYERGLEDLKISIDAILDKFKHNSQKRKTGELLREVDVRNADNAITEVSGVNITKQFMPSVANSDDLHNYKIVKKNQFVFSGMQTGRDKCIRIALQNKDEELIVSPAYSVLEVSSDVVVPEYIQMWYSRAEMDRIGWFMSDSSIRSNLDLPRFYDIIIPVPSKEEQDSIVQIYSAYTLRREINERLKAQIKDICPILIKGAVEEASNA